MSCFIVGQRATVRVHLLRASPRSVVLRLIAEQIGSSGFLGGSL
jgi:hypothetical protein